MNSTVSGQRISDEKMILAILSNKDLLTASKTLGISVQSIYNRLRKPQFRQRLHQERQGKFEVANSKLTDSMGKAISTLVEILEDTNISAGVRIRASQILLDITLKVTEQTDIIQRLDSLEEQLQSHN